MLLAKVPKRGCSKHGQMLQDVKKRKRAQMSWNRDKVGGKSANGVNGEIVL